MSLTKNDLQKISKINTDTLMSFWELVLEPNFSKMVTKDELNERFKEHTIILNKKIDDARDFIVKHAGPINGESVIRDRKLNEKSDTSIDLLEQKHVFNHTEATQIKNISPFPAPPFSS